MSVLLLLLGLVLLLRLVLLWRSLTLPGLSSGRVLRLVPVLNLALRLGRVHPALRRHSRI